MSFKTKFVAIGGKSGVGKTTLIKSLIALYPNSFKRPISYTTRHRRSGENNAEYIFLSEDEIKLLHEQGKLVNLDFNYGNYYAMDKIQLMKDIESKDLILIKEIHPQYHYKLKGLTGENCISVLIKGFESETDNRDRSFEDDEYYKLYKDDEFDLVFVYDKSITQEENATLFYQRLVVYIKTNSMFPPTRIIDKENSAGYSKVADEFTEEKRITTRNFHEVSKNFWSTFICELRNNETVLELGPGRGWLRNSFEWPCINYCCVDISPNMNSGSNRKEGIIASARCIPVKSKSIDCVVASLADPYFYPEMLCEVSRILKDGACFVLTLPDKEWAVNLRGDNNNKTTFILSNGNTATVFSFTFSDEEIEYLADICGFAIRQLLHLQGSKLTENEISPAIIQASEKADKAVYDLSIVTAIVLEKRKDD